MKINKNNLFARYYQWIYGNLPNDVCSFFWGSVLAIGLLPLLAVGRLFNRSGWNYEFGKTVGAGILFYFLYGMCTLVGLITYAGNVLELGEKGFSFSEHYHLLELSWYGLLFGMPLITVAVIIVLVIIGAIPISIIWLTLKLFKVGISASQRTTIVQNTQDFIGAIKREHCTKINWD